MTFHEIPEHIESRMSYYIAYGKNIQSHPLLRHVQGYLDQMDVPIIPGALTVSCFSDLIYVDYGIGKAEIGDDVVDIMNGTAILVKPGVPYRLASSGEVLRARRCHLQ